MNYGKIVRRINFLNILLAICGIQPVYDQRKNGAKYSIFGVLCIILHTVLCIYSDHKLQEEQGIIRRFLQGIMFAMTYMQRFASLGYPLICVLGAIVQFEKMARFMDLEDHFDLYLKRVSMNISHMYRKIKRMQIVSCVLALIIGAISGWSYVSNSGVFSENPMQFYTYYSGIFFSLNYTLIIFKICNHYYALHLRAELFTRHLKNILEKDITKNGSVLRF